MKFSIRKLLPMIGLFVGVMIGLYFPMYIPKKFSLVVAMVLVAALDSILGALKAYAKQQFSVKAFIGGIVFNGVVAAFLTYLGILLNISLYLGVIFVFVMRMFKNLAQLRKLLLNFDRNSDKL